MAKSLLDTDIFSEILKGVDAMVAQRATDYRAMYGYYTMTSITVMEMIKGLHKVHREERIQQLLQSPTRVEVLPLTAQDAVLAGRIFADLERTGQPIGRADPMIEGIALQQGLTLVTGNTAHYQRVQDVGYPRVLENWRFPQGQQVP